MDAILPSHFHRKKHILGFRVKLLGRGSERKFLHSSASSDESERKLVGKKSRVKYEIRVGHETAEML